MHSAPTLFLTLLSVATTAGAQIILKRGVSSSKLQSLLQSGDVAEFLLQALLTPMVVGGLVMYALSAVAWLIVLARVELSFAYPFVSLAFVITALYGFIALQEPMGLGRLGGVGLIVGGVLLMARS